MDNLKKRIRELEPWLHNIDLGGFGAHEVAEAMHPDKNLPYDKLSMVREWIPEGQGKAIDVGANAGGISFYLEESGFDVIALENGNEGRTENVIDQLKLAKETKNSDITIVEEDALDYLPEDCDLIMAFGVLYHMGDNRKGEIFYEKEFLRKCIESNPDRILLETIERPWVVGFFEEKGHEIVEHIPADKGWGRQYDVVKANG